MTNARGRRGPMGRAPSKALYVAILTEECLNAGVPLKAALSRKKDRINCIPRFKAWKRLIDTGRYSLPGIGKTAGDASGDGLGPYDHTTVLSGARRANKHDEWLQALHAEQDVKRSMLIGKLSAISIRARTPLIPAAGCTYWERA